MVKASDMGFSVGMDGGIAFGVGDDDDHGGDNMQILVKIVK